MNLLLQKLERERKILNREGVYYIEVGTMPPERVKAYLEQIKNDIKQKRVKYE